MIIIDFEYILKNRLFHNCSLLTQKEFIKYAKERGLHFDRDYLERLDRLRIFHPIARFKLALLYYEVLNEEPWIKLSETPSGNKNRELKIPIPFNSDEMSIKTLLALYANGYLFEPSKHEFKLWPTSEELSKQYNGVCIYSRFQLHHLIWVRQWLVKELDSTYLLESDKKTLIQRFEQEQKFAAKLIESKRQQKDRLNKTALICQVLSDRYYPLTQTDQREIVVSGSTQDWNWDKYRKEWDAKEVYAELELACEELKGLQSRICIDAQSFDPMKHWYDLLSYISVFMKEKLTGDALLAQLFYSMEHMIRLFHNDITGVKLHPPNESELWSMDDYYGKGVSSSPLEQLLYIVNRYHLNPNPYVILIVEGEGELTHLPTLFKSYVGFAPAKYGIEIRSVFGISNAEGTKRQDKYTALEKLIDWHHSKNTIVYLAFDKEGRIEKLVKKLMKKKSLFSPRRTVTTAEYVKLWDPCIEFACFTDNEIAECICTLSDNKFTVTPKDIAKCRISPNPNKALMSLYSQCSGSYSLPKIDLLGCLVDSLLDEEHKLKAENIERELIQFLKQVLKTALENHFPHNRRDSQYLQKSGMFGDK